MIYLGYGFQVPLIDPMTLMHSIKRFCNTGSNARLLAIQKLPENNLLGIRFNKNPVNHI